MRAHDGARRACKKMKENGKKRFPELKIKNRKNNKNAAAVVNLNSRKNIIFAEKVWI